MTSNAPKNLSSKQPETKQHYFLVAGLVFFTTAEDRSEPVSLPSNGIITNGHGQIRVSDLGAGQQALAQAVADKIGPAADMHLYDVQVTGVSKLGHMLPSEFHDVQAVAEPEPTQEDVAPAKVV